MEYAEMYLKDFFEILQEEENMRVHSRGGSEVQKHGKLDDFMLWSLILEFIIDSGFAGDSISYQFRFLQ